MPNVAKLLLFPKPAPIDTGEQSITLSIGKERYAMTIPPPASSPGNAPRWLVRRLISAKHTKIERVTAQPCFLLHASACSLNA